jgi:hypothetical protein
VHGSAIAPPTPPEVPGLDDGSAAAVLDAASEIINSISAQTIEEVVAEQSKKRRWWRKKK